MITTVEHPRLGEVVLSQSRRARRISISVRGTGCVRLSFPCGVSARRAMEFLECKAGWVEAARARLAQRRAALPPQLPPAAEKARVEELRRAAKADLPDRIGRLSRITGLKYNKLTGVQSVLEDDGIAEDEFLDSVNFLAEEGYIHLRRISNKDPAALADTDYTALEAKLTGKGIRLLAGGIEDDMIEV